MTEIKQILHSVGVTKAAAAILVKAIEEYRFMVGDGEEELSAIYEALKEVAE